MADDPERLRERAAGGPEDIDPESVVRALETNPEESAAIGDLLLTLEGTDAGAGAVAAVTDRLDRDADAVRAGAASALGVYLDDSPDVDPAVARSLAARFDDEYSVARREAGIAVRALARDDPEAALRVVDSIPGLLDPTDPRLATVGLDLVEIVVETDPGAAVDLLGPLFETVRSTPEVEAGVIPTQGEGMGSGGIAHDQAESFAKRSQRMRNRTASLIGQVFRAEPSAVEEHRDALATVLDAVASGAVRATLAEALGDVAETDPGVVVPVVEPLADLLDDEDPGVVAAAAWTLGILGERHGERVADAARAHVDSLERLLSGEERARVVAVGLLSHVCEHHPEATEGVTDTLVAQLDVDSPRLRAMAALALGHAGAEAAVTPLQDLAETDPEEEVRAVAADALDRIDH